MRSTALNPDDARLRRIQRLESQFGATIYVFKQKKRVRFTRYLQFITLLNIKFSGFFDSKLRFAPRAKK